MSGIIFVIIIGLISMYYSKIKEYSEGKGYNHPGMPPFPKGRPIFDSEEYDEDEKDFVYPDEIEIMRQSDVEELERKDSPLLTTEGLAFSQELEAARENTLQPGNIAGKKDKVQVGTAVENDFDELFHIDNVKKGIIWQEILEEPRSRRPFRRY